MFVYQDFKHAPVAIKVTIYPKTSTIMSIMSCWCILKYNGTGPINILLYIAINFIHSTQIIGFSIIHLTIEQMNIIKKTRMTTSTEAHSKTILNHITFKIDTGLFHASDNRK